MQTNEFQKLSQTDDCTIHLPNKKRLWPNCTASSQMTMCEQYDLLLMCYSTKMPHPSAVAMTIYYAVSKC